MIYIVGTRQRFEEWCRGERRSTRCRKVIHIHDMINTYACRPEPEDMILNVSNDSARYRAIARSLRERVIPNLDCDVFNDTSRTFPVMTNGATISLHESWTIS